MTKAITLPFTFDANGRVASTTDLKKIIQDRVVLVVMSLLGERVMRPTFGTYVRGTTFENIEDALTIIRQEVELGFSNWLTYLQIMDVNAKIDDEGNLDITVNYKFGTSSNAENVTVKTALLTQSGDIITEAPYGQQ